MFVEHNWVNRKHRLDSGEYFWTHGHVVSEYQINKSCLCGGKIEIPKGEATRSNQMGGSVLVKLHM